MFKKVAVLSVVATTVLAQSNSSSTNALIPPTISDSCTKFLNTLNTDTTIASCITPITTALAAFAPGSNSTIDSSTISSALGSLCVSSTISACSNADVRTQLTNFYGACSAELTSNPNTVVATTYDVMYTLVPLLNAVCTKSSTGDYCVSTLMSSGSSSPSNSSELIATGNKPSVPLIDQSSLWSPLSSPLTRRAENTTIVNAAPVVVPNVTTFQQTGIVFLFLTPSSPSSVLCQSCSASVMQAYTSFEQIVPYGPGLSQSVLLQGQQPLYSAMQSQCGGSFLSGQGVQAAGGISQGLLGSGALDLKVGGEFGVIGSLLAVALGFVALL